MKRRKKKKMRKDEKKSCKEKNRLVWNQFRVRFRSECTQSLTYPDVVVEFKMLRCREASIATQKKKKKVGSEVENLS